MSISSSMLLCYGAIPDLDEASIRPTRDPPPGQGRRPGGRDAAPGAGPRPHRRGHERPRGATGCSPPGSLCEMALGLMGDHPGAGKVQDAIGELDLAIRDIRNVVFDLRQPDPPS